VAAGENKIPQKLHSQEAMPPPVICIMSFRRQLITNTYILHNTKSYKTSISHPLRNIVYIVYTAYTETDLFLKTC